MPTEKELIKERLKKLEEIRKLGINPYPYNYEQKDFAADINSKYAKLKKEEHTKDKVQVAGRLMALRRMGKATFAHVADKTGKVQVYFQVDNMGKDEYKFLKLLDIGDWIGVEGTIFKTKTGEVTIEAKKAELLTKTIRPLPEKWHGLQDKEIRYRKRYLDLIMNPEVRDVFVKRTLIIDTIRNALNKKGFLEVDTPILQPIYGGAAARPFKSHLNELDMPVYLRISNELYLKRLLVGGFGKVYEFSKDFRNEGIDRTHNPEFLQIEIYQAYADFNDMKELVQDLYVAAAKAIHGKTKFKFGEQEIDVKKPWQEYTMVEALKKFGEVDVADMSDEDILDLADSYNVEMPQRTRGWAIQGLFEELVEEKLIQPTLITHHPVETTPLCKHDRKSPESHFIERFEPFIAGMEIANAYSELNDPVLQRKYLEEQAKELRAGSEESHPMDEDFIQAMEYGMPPTGGIGIGIDRMCMIILNLQSIRDVIFFPFMKPEHEEKKK
ncbi:lysine--tRNA ligase [Candidatus Woesearchaeota archaeon]|nr:lysine--tRNA ligase [Candidatus Woesearchaeota archaeon]MBW3006461.1 lysine--tRNA ligase [Candidatus Woesearchaeota archaeon]